MTNYQQIVEDSSAYQLILDRGIEIGLRKAFEEARHQGAVDVLQTTLLRLGEKILGTPLHSTTKDLLCISDIERLRRMQDRLLDVSSWAELLSVT